VPSAFGLTTASPGEAGFTPDLAERLDAGIRSGLLRDLHAVLVARTGALLLERYEPGVDQCWGQPLGRVEFGPDTLHDLRSVTKSIVGLLYGIALDRGLVPPPEAPLLAAFPQYADLAGDSARAALTVGHALTMTMGLEWDESLPYSNPLNSEIAMERAPDRIRFALDRPILAAPGKGWTYSGGAVAILGALIAQGTGQTLQDFARSALFAPTGITEFGWAQGSDGIASAASGLRLRPRDLLRIGMLVLNNGVWDSQQIVPRAWLDASFKPATQTGDGLEYGRLWFLGMGGAPAIPDKAPWIAGFGNGGQRLWIMPQAGLVVVSLSGAYNQPDAWITPTRVWREIVLANLLRL
jgi:CubicO group peptidase (beta-lactamase class C family)